MRKLMTVAVSIFVILIISCVPELAAPHSNPLDPLYESGDVTPPAVTDLATLNEYYNSESGVNLSWETPEESVLLLRSASAIDNNAVENKTQYSVGQIIGNAKVIYTGTGTSFVDSGFTGDGTYYYRLFSYDQSFNYSAGGLEVSTVVYLDAVYVHYNGSSGNSGVSGSPIADIQEALNKAKEVGVGSIRVAGDSAETSVYDKGLITMLDGISLYGGYNPTDWTAVANPVVWPTVIERTGIDAGDFVTVSASDLSGNEVISGFKIRNYPSVTAQNSAALAINNSDILVEYCDIKGGNADSAESCGIKIINASPKITDNYSISGGADGDSIGIIITGSISDPSNPLIYDNNYSDDCITGGGGASGGKAVGIEYRAYSGGSLWLNKIKGANTETSKYSYGIYISGTGTAPVIYNNIIRGEATENASNNRAHGVYLSGCPETVAVYNNVIFTENIQYANALTVDTSDVLFRNNTIYCSSGGTVWIINIEAADGQTDILIQNNIIKAASGYGINQKADVSGVSSYLIERNNFSGVGVAYYDEPSMEQWTTVALMETNIPGCSNNITDNFGLTLDGRADTTSPEALAFAVSGFDGSGASPGWGFTTDFDGTARTGDGSTGWSMGAYEYDAP